MDLASLGQVFLIWILFVTFQVFLIWMLLSITLGNCATSKFKVHNVLSNLDETTIDFKFLFSQMEIQIKVNCHN
jgi:hypothetical protein